MNAQLFEPDASQVLYDIRSDSLLLSRISAASLSTGRLGLAIEHGVVGTPEWWEAVRQGLLDIKHYVGMIIRADGGIHGDSYLLRIKGDDEIKSWVAWYGFDARLIGSTVEVVYTPVQPKFPPRPGFMVELILQVRLLDGCPS